MLFQIKEIILWPRNLNFGPRKLPFELGKVNVITGASRTGKSAIIPIIDYCLGSEKCSIPVNTIRDNCSWFGIVIETEMGPKLFARREPGSSKSTGDMYVLEGKEFNIPEKILDKNSSVESVKRTLDELSRLTLLEFNKDDDGGGGLKDRPGFRDLFSFIFQPQNIIANRDVLFYKADTYEHREKLKTIFPYVLNAITPAILAKQHECSLLQKELRRKVKEYNTLQQVSAKWIAEIKTYIAEAKELGLIKEPIDSNATREQLLDILRVIVNCSNIEDRVTQETITDAVKELIQIQKEESEASSEVFNLRKRFSEMSILKDASIDYQGALQVQRERLQISKWLVELHDPEQNCPICGNALASETNKLKILLDSLKEIENTAGRLEAIPAAFDREFERVRAELGENIDRLQAVKQRRKALEKSSEEAKKRQYDSLKVSRFIGNLEEALKTLEKIGTDRELSSEIEALKKRVNELENEISEVQIKVKTKRALEKINLNAGKLLPDLDIERPNDPISLSEKELSLTVKGINREDYLWEIGSGSNWLSYHVAIILALHEFFLSLPFSPIPGFIVLDQPSQVYFPKRLADKENEGNPDPQFEKDEDVEAVRKIFKVLSKLTDEFKGKFQVIVLDHASETVWGKVEKINRVEEWRNGKTLVPIEWIIRKIS